MSGPASTTEHRQRRRYLLAAVAMVAAIVGLALAAGFLAEDPPPVPVEEEDDPSIIPRPGSGVAPDRPGDRGGWGQLLVLGLVVAGVGVVGLLAWRSSVRARAGARRVTDPGDAPTRRGRPPPP